MTEHINTTLCNKERAAQFIIAAADKWGAMCYSRPYADGDWFVSVDRNGKIETGGYAKETCEKYETMQVKDLPWSELGHLLECCAVYGWHF